ncbi:hypothetical protein DSAG12_03369 [Promethearchaeum syntrophicum]|uniref:DUF4263 domain-containing protein n=1 Tax=Promethearchaeum syntrophicum TaxID=2594042 RepID=A0A5B9DEL3_9ARCH|nr:hypothetical protein [Candidatus Prometheoarchaeum syntrophicum]QEE17532.1 hypothetical protein DSAG12_03369 [Candidatus Prometheoarchaeum syntrophicum]
MVKIKDLNPRFPNISFEIDKNWIYVPELFGFQTNHKSMIKKNLGEELLIIYSDQTLFSTKKDKTYCSCLRIIQNSQEFRKKKIRIKFQNNTQKNKNKILYDESIELEEIPFRINVISDLKTPIIKLEKILDTKSGIYEIERITTSKANSEEYNKYQFFLIDSAFKNFIENGTFTKISEKNCVIISETENEVEWNNYTQININNPNYIIHLENILNDRILLTRTQNLKKIDFLNYWNFFKENDDVKFKELQHTRKWEGYFQYFFKCHPDILSSVFQIDLLLKAEAPVAVVNSLSKGGKFVDLFFIDDFYGVLIEIKTPFKEFIDDDEYRTNICTISPDLASSCVQLKNYHNKYCYYRIVLNATLKKKLEEPKKPYLIIGNLEAASTNKVSTFEIYRKLMDPFINLWTFDQIFSRYQ